MTEIRASLVRFAALLVLASAAGCWPDDGGGGGGTIDNPPAPRSNLSGTVYAPAATLTALRSPGRLERLGSLLVPTAVAVVDGVVKVADGTRVELVRINSAGVVIAVLAATQTSAGEYSFDVAALGLTPASDLVVQAVNPASNVALRAIVSGGTVDVSPDSEATLRLLVERLAATPNTRITDVSPQEAQTLLDSVEFAAWEAGVAARATIDASVGAIVDVVKAAGLATMFDTAAKPGDAEFGPGDLGNFFPLDVGAKWTYQDYLIDDLFELPQSGPYTRQVTGTTSLNGVTLTVISGERGEERFRKTPTGIYEYRGDAVITIRTFPYRLRNQETIERDLDFGSDRDGDGISERFDRKRTTSIRVQRAIDPKTGNNALAAWSVDTRVESILILSGSGERRPQSTQVEFVEYQRGKGLAVRSAFGFGPDLKRRGSSTRLVSFSSPGPP